jgi:hypothetical protein
VFDNSEFGIDAGGRIRLIDYAGDAGGFPRQISDTFCQNFPAIFLRFFAEEKFFLSYYK